MLRSQHAVSTVGAVSDELWHPVEKAATGAARNPERVAAVPVPQFQTVRARAVPGHVPIALAI
jgi:hypothetical protein